jgi:hypothetical protein
MRIKTVIVFGIPIRVAGNRGQRSEPFTPAANRSAVRVAQQDAPEFGARSHSARELAGMLAGVFTAGPDLQQLQNSQ